jgi:hypothetical protein
MSMVVNISYYHFSLVDGALYVHCIDFDQHLQGISVALKKGKVGIVMLEC